MNLSDLLNDPPKPHEDGEWLEWTQQPRVARGGKVKWVDGQLIVETPQSGSFERALGIPFLGSNR